jgi:Chaperone of endosialidase
MTIGLKADPSGTFGSITINGTEAIRVNPNGIPANSIAFTPSGNIAAANVQAAIQELDTETQAGLATKVAKSGDTMTGNLTVIADGGRVATSFSGDAATLVKYPGAAITGLELGSPTVYGLIEFNRSTGVLSIGRTGYFGKIQIDGNGALRFPQGYNGTGEAYAYSSGVDVFDWRTGGSASYKYFSMEATGRFIARSGHVAGNGAYENTSDRRVKENIVGAPYGLTEVLSLNPVSFNRIGQERVELGFVAQDVQPVIPEAVSQFDEDHLGLSESMLIPVLVKAIQELSAKVAELEARLA